MVTIDQYPAVVVEVYLYVCVYVVHVCTLSGHVMYCSTK